MPQEFTGEFPLAVEEGNLVFPSEWAFQQELTVRIFSMKKYLKIMPIAEWMQILNILYKHPTSSTDFIVSVLLDASEIGSIANGKLALSPKQLGHHALKNNTPFLVGVLTTFEVWDQADWKNHASHLKANQQKVFENLGL